MKVGQNADKKNVLDELLELGMVLVAIDARADGVDVPDHLGVDPQLRLNLSWRFGRPMEVDAWGIFAELTFGGVPYPCKFPWDAIFLVVSHINGESYLFPDHVPKELLHQAAGEHVEAMQKAAAKPKSKRGRPTLSLVPQGDGAHLPGDTAEDVATLAPSTEKKKSHPAATRKSARSTKAVQPISEASETGAAQKPADHEPQRDDDGSSTPPNKPARSRGHLRLIK